MSDDPTTSGEAAPGAGEPAPVPGGGLEKLATPPNQTDSSQMPETEVVRPASAAPDLPHGRGEDVDRRAERRAERLVAFWFLVSVFGTLGFIVDNFVGDKHEQYYTPTMGLALALAVGGVGFGVIIWAKRLMPAEDAVQERHPFRSSDVEIATTEETLARGFADTGLGQRPLVRRTLLGAGLALGGVFVVPLLNLYNRKPGTQLDHTHWVAGSRLVNDQGAFIKVGDLSIGGIATVFPAVPVTKADGTTGYDALTSIDDKADSTTILIRLVPGEDKPRKGRENWSYDGHVAYSKICTHAGCPVSLYEQQTHHLLCPCHQSVFNVLDGCRAIFGPASRSLPQLNITVDDQGYFVARGDYSEPIGPAFWERS